MAGIVKKSFKLQIQDELIPFESLENWSKQSRNADSYVGATASFISDWMNNQPTIAVQTSGSTGKPTSVALEKEKMIASAQMTNQFFELREGKNVLLPLSANYIAGKMMLVRAMIGGYSIHVVEPTSTPLAGSLQEYDFAPLVPLQVEESLNDLNKVKTVLIGGAPVSTQLEDRLQQLDTNTKFFHSFGMTETISHIALRNLSAKDEHYTCLQGISVSQGNRGNLIINAPHLLEEVLETNDAVEILSEQKFKWLGRLDFAINSGGVKIHPEIVERKLSRIISRPFFIHHVPHKQLGQAVILVIEGTTPLEPNIVSEMQQTLDKYEYPKEIHYVKTFTYTETGKVKRQATVDNAIG